MAGKYSIEAAFNFIDNATRPMSKINNQAKLVNRSLKNMYLGAEKTTERMGSAFKKLGGNVLKISGIAALLNADKVIGFATKDIKNAMEFQTALAKIGTVADLATMPLNKMSDGILGLSNKMGINANSLAETMYQVVGAGVSVDKALSVVEATSKLTSVAFVGTENAIKGVTTVLNAYRMGAEQAEKITNQLYLATTLGNADFDAMANSMKNVVPTAASFGIDTSELFASVSVLTGMGEDTAKVMKSMGDAMKLIANPSKQAADMARRMGIDFSQTALRSKGLSGILNDIAQKTGGSQQAMQALFGNADIARMMSGLATTGADAFTKTISEMQNATAIDEAFGKMMDTPQKRWENAMNKMHNSGIKFGTALLPIVEKVIEKISMGADKFSQIDFAKITPIFEQAFGAVNALFTVIVGVTHIMWQFRGVIFAVVGIMGAYYAISMLVIGVSKGIALWEGIKQASIFAATLATKGQAAAVKTLTKETVAYSAIQKFLTIKTTALTIAEALRNKTLGFLTRGTLIQSAATAKMAVANGTATVAQWLLNAAMTANPIFLVIVAIAALVGIIVLLVKNWEKVTSVIKNNTEK